MADTERLSRGLVPVALVDASAADLAARGELVLEPGEDDLGSFVSAAFRLESGREAAVLERVPAEPPGVELLIDVDERDVPRAIAEVVAALGLPASSVRSRALELEPDAYIDSSALVEWLFDTDPAVRDEIALYVVLRALSAELKSAKRRELRTAEGLDVLVRVLAPAAVGGPAGGMAVGLLALVGSISNWFWGRVRRRRAVTVFVDPVEVPSASADTLATDAWRFYVARTTRPVGVSRPTNEPVDLRSLPQAVREATTERLAA